jgi:hypothetical protein
MTTDFATASISNLPDTAAVAQFLLRDCHSGNLRRVVVVASTAPFGPSALMLNW